MVFFRISMLQEYFGVTLQRVKGSVLMIRPLQLQQFISYIANLETTITKSILQTVLNLLGYRVLEK